MPWRNEIRILLIDDDYDEYLILKEVASEAKSLKLKIEWVDNYEEGLECILEARHEVYLIDYRLGSHNGIELLEEVQSRDKGQSIYILLTGQEGTDLDRDAMQKGADDYIIKDELNATVLSRAIMYGLDRRKNYIELEKKQNQYLQLYQNTKTPVIEVDLSMNVLKVNKAFITTFGYPPDFYLDSTKQQIKVWDLLECNELEKQVTEHINSKKEHSAEVFRCKNQLNQEILVQLNVYELIDADGAVSFQIVVNDLTKKINEDEARYKQEKLDLMEKMARIVAHEVRNPLTNIILASEQISPGLAESKLLYTEMIRRNSNRIETLIRKFLDTFKTIEIKKEKTSIIEIVDHCLEDLDDKTKLMQVDIVNSMDRSLPSISLDKEKIQLVVLNVLNNGIQACEKTENGTIHISAEVIEGFLEVEIADNGHGISTEDMKRLFEPFFTKKASGLGLGLTTSLNILQNHGGTIKAFNNSKGGASFVIALPIYDSE